MCKRGHLEKPAGLGGRLRLHTAGAGVGWRGPAGAAGVVVVGARRGGRVGQTDRTLHACRQGRQGHATANELQPLLQRLYGAAEGNAIPHVGLLSVLERLHRLAVELRKLREPAQAFIRRWCERGGCESGAVVGG